MLRSAARFATTALSGIDDFYRDRSEESDSVLTALVQRLSEPSPRDRRTTTQLSLDKNLAPRWHDWAVVGAACQELADMLLSSTRERP